MTQLIHLELFTDFFNKIGQKRTSAVLCRKATFGGGGAKRQNYFRTVAWEALGGQKFFDPNGQLPDAYSGSVIYRVSDRRRCADIS